MKKNIIFILSRMQHANGVSRVLASLCSTLNLDEYNIDILPLYTVEQDFIAKLDSRITVLKGIGGYFRGLDRILMLIPPRILYKIFVRKKYDIEVGFQTHVPTRIIGGSTNHLSCHSYWMHGYRLWKKEYLKADKVVCVSKYNADKCFKELGYEGNVDYCYNLTDDQLIKEASTESVNIILDNNQVKFVTVGRLSPEKGFLRLLSIIKDLRQEGKQCQLVLVGDGPLMPDIEKYVKQNKMEDYVFLTGSQKNPHKFTVKCDVFICSSFSEGYSTACTEAAILGVPIITTDVPGGEEIINTARCGFLTGLDDESLKNAMRKVIDEPAIILSWKSTLSVTSENFGLSYRSKKVAKLFEEFSLINALKIEQYESKKNMLCNNSANND